MQAAFQPEQLRNIAIIAHVDHGKTTLVDAILKQTGTLRAGDSADRILDSGELERERGMTILSKNTAVLYGDYKINIVDTPGHADFSGEVERVLGMVEGTLLVVDAAEGPMPQTRFVLRKAFEHQLVPVVVINKIDRPGADPLGCHDEVLDLFIDLGADEHQIDFPVVYTNAKAGTATLDLEQTGSSIEPLLDQVIRTIPAPSGDPQGPLQWQISTVDYDDYVGRIGIGRITRGQLERGATITHASRDGEQSAVRAQMLYSYHGLARQDADLVSAGDIAAVAGIEGLEIGDTLTDLQDPQPLPPVTIEEPTLSMNFQVNNSPFAGRDGQVLTSRQLKARLERETEKDVSLRVEATAAADVFKVSGRGELHLAVLIETMRREGFELAVSKPEVIIKENEAGKKVEPYERLVLEFPADQLGTVMEELGPRKAEVLDMHTLADGRTHLRALLPTRCLLGFRSLYLSLTRGNGILYRSFDSFGPQVEGLSLRRQGALVAWETGTTTAHALMNAEQRGRLFVGAGEDVYQGQVVGECARPSDLWLNVCKKRQASNMRSASAEELTRLSTPDRQSLEQALEWIAVDELVEVTPAAIRIRKQDRQRP